MMRKLFCVLTTVTLPMWAGSPELDELRIELDDIKHFLKTTQVELNILDERVKKQNSSKAQSQSAEASTLMHLSSQVSALEKKVTSLEKTWEKAAADLRALSTTAAEALTKIQALEQDLFSHEKKLDEVSKLKGTLTKISSAIGQKAASEVASGSKTYRVKAGDSLEKIARKNQVSVDALRKTNNLSQDKIVVGQELRIPDESA